MYLSQTQQKKIKTLSSKRYRQKWGLFKIERKKIIKEALKNQIYPLQFLVATKEAVQENEWLESNANKIFIASESQIKGLSSYQSMSNLMGIFKTEKKTKNEEKIDGWSIALWDIQDPSNLGAILRIADWYNVGKVYCSKSTVDIFNPKAIDASMGSFLRVDVQYTDLRKLIANSKHPVYQARLEGKSVYHLKKEKGIILIGNEGNGLPEDIIGSNLHNIQIPRLGRAESLNASVACGILVDRLVANC